MPLVTIVKEGWILGVYKSTAECVLIVKIMKGIRAVVQREAYKEIERVYQSETCYSLTYSN